MSKSLYNEAFYDKQSLDSYNSAVRILSILKALIGKELTFDSVIDFGCGVGSWLAAAKSIGVNNVIGTDGDYVPTSKLMISRDEFFSNNLAELDSIKLPQKKFDLAMSLEVAEHLDESNASLFVKKLTSYSDLVLFSAAIPYQGGHGHINENWLSYWEKKFNDSGYTAVDLIRPEIWNQQGICWWYRQNIILFIKNDSLKKLPVGTSINRPLDLVHPEQFLVSIHREKTQRYYSLKQDINHFAASASFEVAKPLSYGNEYSYTEHIDEVIDDLAVLKQHPSFDSSRLKSFLSPLNLSQRAVSVCSDVLEHAPDYLIIGDTEKYREPEKFQLESAGFWYCETYGLGFFNSYLLESDSAFYDRSRRFKAFAKIRQILEKNGTIGDAWMENLVNLSKDEINFEWYSSIFNRPWVNRSLIEVELDYLYLNEEIISIIHSKMPNTKIFILKEECSSEEKLLNLSKEFSFSFSSSLLEHLLLNKHLKHYFNFLEQSKKWTRVFGNENVSIVKFSNLDELRVNFEELPID